MHFLIFKISSHLGLFGFKLSWVNHNVVELLLQVQLTKPIVALIMSHKLPLRRIAAYTRGTSTMTSDETQSVE